MSVVLLLGGLVLLAWASEHFVLGAARVAAVLRISTLVVGVVIVGFGTSLPEVVVSGLAARRGELEVAAGNIIGSNVANLALLLGVGALIRPLTVRSGVVRREAPIAFASVVFFTVLVQNGFTRVEGAVMLLAMGVAILVVLLAPPPDDVLEAEVTEALGPQRRSALGREGLRTLLGLAGTLLGAELLLRGALDIAESLGLAEGFVGLTLVAFGTSLPELVTVVQAARHDEPDLVAGNLLGSTTFNSLMVAGVAALIGPGLLVDSDLTVFGPLFMVAVTGAVWFLMRTGHVVSRGESALLLGAYVAFVVAVV